MGFLDLFRRRRDPAPVEQRAEWGSSAIPLPTEGGAATYASAATELRSAEASLQAVAVWSACDLIASIASQLPLDTYQQRAGERPKQIRNGKLIEDPGGDGHGAQDWIYQYLMSKLLRGNVYGRELSRDPATGYPTQLYLYHPDTVMGWRDRVTGEVNWIVDGVKRTDVWHRRSYPMPGTLLGLSPVRQHVVTIAQGTAAARFGLQFFTDGAMPTGILRNTETTVDQTMAAKVKARWMAIMHGSREPAVFGKGWEWQGVQVAPDESQFLETQKYTSAQCARIFGPNVAEILGYETGGSMTYNNMVDRDMAFLKYTLNRWLRDLEVVFTGMLPKPQYVKFNRGALLEMDLLNRYRAYQLGISSKFLLPDEARAREDDLPPLTDAQKAELAKLDVKAPAAAGDAGPKARGRDQHDLEVEERNFDPGQLRDPHTGEWIDTTPGDAVAKAAKALGRISEDDFYAAHGEDYYDQYGTPDLGAILWKNGTASLYQDLGNGKVRAFGDVDSKTARQLSGDLKWAVGQPESSTPSGGKLAGHRQTDLGHITAEVGYVYDANGDLVVRVTMPPVGKDKKPTVISMEDLDQVEGLVGDLNLLADEMDSGAYTGDTPGLSRRAAVTPAGIKGAHELHQYWTKGEGLAKWADHPHPWTALYHHLVKHMPPAMAKRVASQWFHDVFGIWPGEREGDNPVGPG